jgi:gamma-glutamyl hercynylcysteine S-oxide synthase
MRRVIVTLTLAFTVVFTAYGSRHEAVISNADWTPVEQDFDGVVMALVPSGCFMMGSTPEQVEDAYASFVEQFGEDASVRAILESEMPQHEQCFEEPFWIDRYPVTQGDFDRLAGKRSVADRFSGAERPVETINWYEARDFCELRGARLPTEAEWEYAARGPDSIVYPWGDEWQEDNLAWNRAESLGTADVGSIPAGISWVGAYDLSGNVWEWTSTIYDLEAYPYPYDADDGRSPMFDTDHLRVLRGGAWSSVTLAGFRAAYRVGSRPQSRYYSLGFRCVLPEPVDAEQ